MSKQTILNNICINTFQIHQRGYQNTWDFEGKEDTKQIPPPVSISSHVRHTACQQCSLMHMWTDTHITRTTKFFIASGCFPPKWIVKLFARHRRGKSRAAVRSRCAGRCVLCSEKRGEAGGEAGSCTYRVPSKPFLFLKIAAAPPTWTRGGKKSITVRDMHSNDGRATERTEVQ